MFSRIVVSGERGPVEGDPIALSSLGAPGAGPGREWVLRGGQRLFLAALSPAT